MKPSRRVSGGFAKGYPKPLAIQEQDKSSCRALRSDEVDVRLATWMWELITRLQKGQKEPNFKKWAITIRLMRDREIAGLERAQVESQIQAEIEGKIAENPNVSRSTIEADVRSRRQPTPPTPSPNFQTFPNAPGPFGNSPGNPAAAFTLTPEDIAGPITTAPQPRPKARRHPRQNHRQVHQACSRTRTTRERHQGKPYGPAEVRRHKGTQTRPASLRSRRRSPARPDQAASGAAGG